MTWTNESLTLAHNITKRVNQACEGLEVGDGEIFNQVSDVTASLLKWWFEEDRMELRSYNFHEGQKQAILNTIYAHEVLQSPSLRHLYEKIAPEILLESGAMEELSEPKNAHRKYCMKMATGTGKTWVLQALMIWQILNAKHNENNPLFTRNFLIVTPGLVVYDRMLDAFLGKERDGSRDAETSDLVRFKDLFIPSDCETDIFSFVHNGVCRKEDIGSKVTGSGVIAIANWHALSEEDISEDEDDIIAPGVDIDSAEVAHNVLPLTPGKAKGNDLNQLNRKFEGSKALPFLKALPSLMVFNDEAHHIHSIGRQNELQEVEWQKSLLAIAQSKKERFFQLDFSATPYNQIKAGKNPTLKYFPHIIVDFDLKTALKKGLVKSLVLDKRTEVGALSNDELEFAAIRDAHNKVVSLADGQRIMLRAGLKKLRKLEREFVALNPEKRPKMMVMCEDTSVTPLVEEFLQEEGLHKDEILRVDSNLKGVVSQKEWNRVRERLFDIDSREMPRIIISVLMLREGFDVNNVCVIVPLRATESQILLEQTVGRGLRLMWRERDYEQSKKENRTLIGNGEEPKSLIDVLTIVEHPKFMELHDGLMQEGLIGETSDDTDGTKSTGDLITVGLIDGYEKYDFGIPFIRQEPEEFITRKDIKLNELSPFSGELDFLKKYIGQGERFRSEDVETKTRFGDYRVEGGVMTATGYNDYLSRLVKRISEKSSDRLIRSSREGSNNFPYMQIDKPQLANWLNDYIKQYLFKEPFNPLEREYWRVLLLDPVAEHIIRVWSSKLIEIHDSEIAHGEEIVEHCFLSEVSKLTMRESVSLSVSKCIYEKLNYPSRSGGLEKKFIETCIEDSGVEAFCKINEHKHLSVRLRYLRDDGSQAFYSPDFFVRCNKHIFLVETKAQNQMKQPDVLQKKRAALAWCNRVNNLNEQNRFKADWAYVLLGEKTFYSWRERGASMYEILSYATIHDKPQKGLFD